MRQQRGFLMIVAAFLILVFAILAISMAHMFISSLSTSTDQLASSQALAIANSGLEQSSYGLLRPDVPSRTACVNLNTLGAALGQGAVTLSGTAEHPTPIVTLTASITAGASTIPVSDATQLSSAGRVMIDREVIDYLGTSGNDLVRVRRATDGSLATAHNNNTRVGQYQCTADAVGSVPSVTPLGERETLAATQLPEVWTVGDSGLFMQWNYPNENIWNNSSRGTTRNINGISILNSADGWAVGSKQTGNTIISRWDPSTATWATSTFSLNEDLMAVSAVSSQEAWIVGDRNSNDHAILHWDGASWCQLSSPGPSCGGKTITTGISNNQKDLLGLHVIDTNGNNIGNIGFAVGGNSGNGHTLLYNGVDWSDLAVPAQVGQLDAVFVVSANEAWAVGKGSTGNSGRILRWDGATWSVSVTTTSKIRGIFMIDTDGDGLANVGWAIGNNSNAYRYTGAAWVVDNLPGSIQYNGVVMMNANDVWAVGNGGNRAHYDGTAWTVLSTGGNDLNAVALIGPRFQSQYAWREQFQ